MLSDGSHVKTSSSRAPNKFGGHNTPNKSSAQGNGDTKIAVRWKKDY